MNTTFKELISPPKRHQSLIFSYPIINDNSNTNSRNGSPKNVDISHNMLGNNWSRWSRDFHHFNWMSFHPLCALISQWHLSYSMKHLFSWSKRSWPSVAMPYGAWLFDDDFLTCTRSLISVDSGWNLTVLAFPCDWAYWRLFLKVVLMAVWWVESYWRISWTTFQVWHHWHCTIQCITEIASKPLMR